MAEEVALRADPAMLLARRNLRRRPEAARIPYYAKVTYDYEM